MRYRCAVLDDYQNVAPRMADWSGVAKDIDVTVFNRGLGGPDEIARALQGYGIVCLMRERTPFPRALIEKLPDLKLLVTSGMRNAAIDVAAAKERGIVVCGTEGAKHPTAELAVGLMLDLARNISVENARMKAGEPWQATVGADLFQHTLGIIGLGNLGARVAKVGQAFGMKVLAWSQNLKPEKCAELGVEYATKADLFQKSDFITIHTVLSDRTRGLVSATDLAMMKQTAYIINTSRGPIIDESALIAALAEGRDRRCRPRRIRCRAASARSSLSQAAECDPHPASRLCHARWLCALLWRDGGSDPRLAGWQADAGDCVAHAFTFELSPPSS